MKMFQLCIFLITVYELNKSSYGADQKSQRLINSVNSNTSPSGRFAYQNVIQVAPVKKPNSPDSLVVKPPNPKDLVITDTTTMPQFTLVDEDSSSSESTNFGVSEEFSEDERRKLCPRTSPEFRFDIKRKKCSEIGSRGHCGENMSFYEDEDNPLFGFCDCAKSEIPLVFHLNSNKCYTIYSQAYCQTKQWLVFNRELQPICVPRKCKSVKEGLLLPLNGDGPCVNFNSASQHCDPEEIVKFAPESVIASCQSDNDSIMRPRVLAPSASMTCSPGTYRSIAGKCQSTWRWD